MLVDAGDTLVIAADIAEDRAAAVAGRTGADHTASWTEVVDRPDVDTVVVSTSNEMLAEASIAALRSGKNVLCEKPMGRTSGEALAIVDAARTSGRVLKVGFNHRFHPAIAAAHALVRDGVIGEPFAIRSLYGHGGRAGLEREWRADAGRSGGGELLDQGVHIVDLARWFMGEIVEVQGFVKAYYWNIDPVEDNAFAMLRTSSGGIVSLHTSWTQWLNTFRFEILGRDGFLRIDGLGGSYGPEMLTVGTRNADSSPPIEKISAFPGEDRSWHAEWQEFASAIAERRDPVGDAQDGLAAARIIDAIYASATTGNITPVARS